MGSHSEPRVNANLGNIYCNATHNQFLINGIVFKR